VNSRELGVAGLLNRFALGDDRIQGVSSPFYTSQPKVPGVDFKNYGAREGEKRDDSDEKEPPPRELRYELF